jgi:hypothetical protein
MAQADTLARELHLSAADRLLDLGTGRGWPGLYLAAKTEPYAEELARLEAPGAFAQRQADRRTMLAAIHAGLLRRALLLAQTRRWEPTAGGRAARLGTSARPWPLQHRR